MIKCCEECIPCCDYCIHAIPEYFEKNGRVITDGPIGCILHCDEEHQYIADSDGCCEDFHCFLANKE
jgi:hypothetical protein